MSIEIISQETNRSRPPLRVLFSIRHWGLIRPFESVVRRLAERGHVVDIISDRGERLGWLEVGENLTRDFRSVSCARAPKASDNKWFFLARDIRKLLDYLRYLEPAYQNTPKLRLRAAAVLPLFMRPLLPLMDRMPRWSIGILRRSLRFLERVTPSHTYLHEFLRDRAPDVVLMTPLIYLGSSQLEVLRGSKALGLRTALCVGSWDHLSSKALLRDYPDRVLLWNETQKAEAVEFHGVPDDRIVVTGAQCFDHWFERKPSLSRDAFCAGVGLRPDRPFHLYVCSALFHGSPVEAEFVVKWVEAIRTSPSAALRESGILIRPHPSRTEEWKSIDLSGLDNVVLYGSNPIDQESKSEYYDSLYHCATVTGLNTSAFLETAIVGRPAHTILVPEFWDNQEGTIHFHYLLNVGGGLLQRARTLEEHLQQLEASLALDGDASEMNRAFVDAFIRSPEEAQTATEVFVEAVECLGYAAQPAPEQPPKGGRFWAAALYPLARLIRWIENDSRRRRRRKMKDREIRLLEDRRSKVSETKMRMKQKAKWRQQKRRARWIARLTSSRD